MTADTAPVTAALRRLAEAEEACQGSVCRQNREATRRGLPVIDVLDECQGYGRVPLFRDAEGKALFRKVCPGCGGKPEYRSLIKDEWSGAVIMGTSGQHIGCQGLGWLPLPQAQATIGLALVAARSRGWQMEIVQKEKRSHVWLHQGVKNLAFRDCDAGEEREAAILALDAALEVRA